jgi:predicted Ser/Thr protein kinase
MQPPIRRPPTCPRRAEAEALACGELPAADRAALEKHMESCEACRSAFRRDAGDQFPKFRNYTILERVGEGGFGVVYRAVHHRKQRTEALKVLFGRSPKRAAYFENEVHLIARLRHPNIAILYEAHLGRPPMYYTMEFVDGRQLDDFLASQDTPLEQRIEIIRKVALAIGYAHDQGVVHRDLKPQNILVDARGEPRIVDFGIAKRLGLLETPPGATAQTAPDVPPPTSPSEGVVGTYGYIAPEQAAGQAVDGRADIYALGVLLYHVITGGPARVAVGSQRLEELLAARKIARAEDLAAIIARCIHPAPEMRYPRCADFVADLENYVAGRATRAREAPPATYRLRRIAGFVLRHHPLPVRAAVASAVALLGAVFFSFARTGGSDARQPTRVALVSFGPSTVSALRAGRVGTGLPGLDPAEPRSWRVLHGALMRALADAEPAVVVWDYDLPVPQPGFDAEFVRGVGAVRCPVVVGSRDFDVNAEPRIAPEIRAAVDSVGSMVAVRPDSARGFVPYIWCTQRGLNPPIPSLAVAAFGAARFPRTDLEIVPQPGHVELRYRKRATRPGEPRYLDQTDSLSVLDIDPGRSRDPLLRPGDHAYHGGLPEAAWRQAAAQIVPYEDALTADPAKRRDWFRGRAVLVGQRIPGKDEYVVGDERFFGCDVHAAALESLLAGAVPAPVSRTAVAIRVCLWSALAAGLVGLIGVNPRVPMLWVAGACGGGILAAIWLAILTVARWQEPAAVEVGIGLSTMLATLGLAFFARTLGEREQLLSPGPTWELNAPAASTTLSATSSTLPLGTDSSTTETGVLAVR